MLFKRQRCLSSNVSCRLSDWWRLQSCTANFFVSPWKKRRILIIGWGVHSRAVFFGNLSSICGVYLKGKFLFIKYYKWWCSISFHFVFDSLWPRHGWILWLDQLFMPTTSPTCQLTGYDKSRENLHWNRGMRLWKKGERTHHLNFTQHWKPFLNWN